MADFCRDILFALCIRWSSKASSRHRKERCSGKIETPKVFSPTRHRGDAGAGSRAVLAFPSELWCVCPACPEQGALWVEPTGVGGTGRRWKTPPPNCAHGKKAKEGIMPSTHKSIDQVVFNELSEQNPRSCRSVPSFVCETVLFCASLCIPMPASPSRSLSIPSWHQSVPNRDYSLYWKHQSLSQVICTDCLVWH